MFLYIILCHYSNLYIKISIAFYTWTCPHLRSFWDLYIKGGQPSPMRAAIQRGFFVPPGRRLVTKGTRIPGESCCLPTDCSFCITGLATPALYRWNIFRVRGHISVVLSNINKRFIWRCPLNLWQEANLQRVKKGDMKASIHRMEIDRIRFVLSSYLRSRLQKVSKFGKRKILSFNNRWHGLTSVYPDRKVFPACVGEREVPAGGRAVTALTGGVCLCQRVSRAERKLQLLARKCCFDQTYHLQVLQQHRDLPESCSIEEDASQPADSGHAQSWWKSSISFFSPFQTLHRCRWEASR